MADRHPIDRPPEAAAPRPVRRFRYLPVRRRRKLSRWRSRVVGLLKVALPMTAVALIALVALWPELQDEPPPPPAAAAGGGDAARMLSPRYFGVDDRSQPFSIAARSASQAENQSEVIELNQPEAEITLDGGAWLALNADHGRYDRAAQRLVLSGEVTLFRDDGFAARTATAHVDLNDRSAWGDAPVAVHGPSGEIQAEGFRIADEGDTVVFTGRSRLVIRDSEANR